MGRNSGNKDLTDLQKGGVLALKENINLSNRQIAARENCNEKSVRNVRRVASDAEKENRDPKDPKTFKPRPRTGRPRILDDRDARRMIRHAIKNRVNRHKPWLQIARECGYTNNAFTINNCFRLFGYGRYPPRYKPSLSPEMKAKRQGFCEEWLEKLRGKEHMIMYTDETAVRIEETRGQQ